MILSILEFISEVNLEISGKIVFNMQNLTLLAANKPSKHLCQGAGKPGSVSSHGGCSNVVSSVAVPSGWLLALIKVIITREQNHIKF